MPFEGRGRRPASIAAAAARDGVCVCVCVSRAAAIELQGRLRPPPPDCLLLRLPPHGSGPRTPTGPAVGYVMLRIVDRGLSLKGKAARRSIY